MCVSEASVTHKPLSTTIHDTETQQSRPLSLCLWHKSMKNKAGVRTITRSLPDAPLRSSLCSATAPQPLRISCPTSLCCSPKASPMYISSCSGPFAFSNSAWPMPRMRAAAAGSLASRSVVTHRALVTTDSTWDATSSGSGRCSRSHGTLAKSTPIRKSSAGQIVMKTHSCGLAHQLAQSKRLQYHSENGSVRSATQNNATLHLGRWPGRTTPCTRSEKGTRWMRAQPCPGQPAADPPCWAPTGATPSRTPPPTLRWGCLLQGAVARTSTAITAATEKACRGESQPENKCPTECFCIEVQTHLQHLDGSVHHVPCDATPAPHGLVYGQRQLQRSHVHVIGAAEGFQQVAGGSPDARHTASKTVYRVSGAKMHRPHLSDDKGHNSCQRTAVLSPSPPKPCCSHDAHAIQRADKENLRRH